VYTKNYSRKQASPQHFLFIPCNQSFLKKPQDRGTEKKKKKKNIFSKLLLLSKPKKTQTSSSSTPQW